MKQIFFSMRILSVLFLFGVGLVTAACIAEPDLLPTPIMPPPNLDEDDAVGEGDTNAETAVPTAAETTISTDTAEPDATATPTPAPTPTLFPTATPVTDPPLSPVSAAALPPTTRDLVFIADGSLKLWNHNSGVLETLYATSADRSDPRDTPFSQLVGDIIQFDVSADGNRIVAARLTHSETITPTISADEQPVGIPYTEYEILFLDVVSRDSWTLVPTVTDLIEVSISPNQKQVAFIGFGLEHQEAPDADALPENARVFIMGTPDGSLRPVGTCTDFCGAITWHPSNDFFTWTDRTALWMFNISGSLPQILLTNETGDPASTRVFQGIAWAQNGRLLLLWQQAWEGGSRVVFDVPTGQIMPVPDSFVYAEPFPTEVSWMRDDRLLIVRSAIGGGSRQATLELWRVNLEENRVVLEESTQPEGSFSVAGGMHLEDGRFAYALLNQEDAQDSGLYLQTSFTEPSERVNGLIPAFLAPDVFWSPDGSGAIVVQNGYVLYAPGSGEGLYEVTAVFGVQAHNFIWLQPGNVPR